MESTNIFQALFIDNYTKQKRSINQSKKQKNILYVLSTIKPKLLNAQNAIRIYEKICKQKKQQELHSQQLKQNKEEQQNKWAKYRQYSENNQRVITSFMRGKKLQKNTYNKNKLLNIPFGNNYANSNQLLHKKYCAYGHLNSKLGQSNKQVLQCLNLKRKHSNFKTKQNKQSTYYPTQMNNNFMSKQLSEHQNDNQNRIPSLYEDNILVQKFR